LTESPTIPRAWWFRSAFTLTELLVVLAVIALLAFGRFRIGTTCFIG